jgi:uncharacterized RDD family membrane protein YckC
MAQQPPGSAGGLVTGEAVVVDLRLAKMPSRSAAFMIDASLQLAALFGLIFLVGALGGSVDGTLMVVLFFVAGIAILVGYPVGMETLTRGRTVGKLALGLRATREDGGAIRLRHALARGLVAVVEIYLTFGAIAVLVSLISPEGKRVGDYLAGTVVVRERAPARNTFHPSLDPRLASWAGTLDLGGLDEATALTVRQFLVRAPDLGADARRTLGTSLCSEVLRRVSPPPPPGVTSEGYLNAVLAERRRRAETADLPAAPAATVAPLLDLPQRTDEPQPPPSGGFAAPT